MVGARGFGHDVDDVKNINAAGGGDVFPPDESRADCHERFVGIGVFGDFEGDGFDAGYYFGGVESVADRKKKKGWVSWVGFKKIFAGGGEEKLCTYWSIMVLVARSKSLIAPRSI